jgi:hypothetical protein
MRALEPTISLEAIARRLNDRRRKPPRGGRWTGKQVARGLARLKPA